MSRYRRSHTPSASWFFTVVTFRRRKILTDETLRDALRAAIQKVRTTRPFVIDAWVLLPDHMHCIWTLPDGDHDYSGRWSLIKSMASRKLPEYHQPGWMSQSKTSRRESTIWQRRFWEHQLLDQADFNRHMDYIHLNPLKHGLVRSVADWPWSSFHRYVEAGVYPLNWTRDHPLIDTME
ncbi:MULTISPECIES: REP-associated tyrosine transposase [Silvimonas]|uniref:REP-associated tyrosine transposase n=1 Tax=Silvimonas TaxID=300264 RepID=UPI0024B3BC97|nr:MULTISPECIES: transposase [Silvimonas]MDR3429526.1 transposase [Silvimonas sp.]